MNAGDDLSNRIRLGEDSLLELKRVLLAGTRVTDPSRDSLADCAFRKLCGQFSGNSAAS